MASSADLLTTRQVSGLLGVEERQVRSLAASGAITRVARGVFDRTSVERYRAGRGSGRTRTWAEHTAWVAIAMLSGPVGGNLLGVGDAQTYRLRAALRAITDPGELAIRLRDRAKVTTWSGHRSVNERVREALVVPDRARLGLVEHDAVVDGYLHHDLVEDLVRRHRLVADPTGPITLRSTSTELGLIEHLATSSRTLAAVDAATALDPRERGVGERALTRKLELFRDDERG